MKRFSRLAILGTLFLICAGGIIFTPPARANEPVMGYWLIETFTLGKAELPQVLPSAYLILPPPHAVTYSWKTRPPRLST